MDVPNRSVSRRVTSRRILYCFVMALASFASGNFAPGFAADGESSKPTSAESDPVAAQRWQPRTNEEAIQRLQRISASTEFGHCCFWAWELELALLKKDRDMAQRIATVLAGLQRPDGRWGLGNPWGRRPLDFKERLPEDAETWDVAEAANALLDYGEVYNDTTFLPVVRKAAAYLKTCIRYSGGKPYLPHMAECNHVLQPHSTINAALLFSRLPEYKELTGSLRASGVAMNFFRLTPQADRITLDPPNVGPKVSDFEQAQVGYYLHLMGDPEGDRILARYRKRSDFNYRLGAAYIVLPLARLGRWAEARNFAAEMKDYNPRLGYEYPLRDIIDFVNAKFPPAP